MIRIMPLPDLFGLTGHIERRHLHRRVSLGAIVRKVDRKRLSVSGTHEKRYDGSGEYGLADAAKDYLQVALK